MKKRIQTRSVLIALLLLVLLLALTGCITSPKEVSAEEPMEEAGNGFGSEPINISLIQGTPSGVWFMLSNGLSECLNRSYPGSLMQITPGSVTTNATRLVNGDAEFALMHNFSAMTAIKGEPPFESPHPEVKGIAAFYASPAQFVLRKDLGVTSFEAIIEQKLKIRLSIGAQTGSMAEAFLRLLDQSGVTIEEMESWGCEFFYKSQDETSQMFSDNALDGYFLVVSSPSPIIMENATNRDLVLIVTATETIDSMCEAYGYERFTIPAGTYSFQTEDYLTYTDYSILATLEDVPEETVYKLTKAIHENLDYVTLIHATLKDLNGETMVGKLKAPLHPGAERYYREAGLID